MKAFKITLRLFGYIGLAIGTILASTVSAEAANREIVIYYQSNWDAPYISYNADDSNWTSAPGEMMDSDIPGFYSKTIPASSLEFVFNDGAGEWDHSASGGNFQVVAPGTYLISHDAIIPVSYQATRMESKIRIHYDTSWPEAYIHYNEDDMGWTYGNGQAMSDSEIYPDEKYFERVASSLEFVTNNGSGTWDNAANGGNYQIDIPGEYRLSNGQLTRIKVASELDEAQWLMALFAANGTVTPYDGGYYLTLTGLPEKLLAFTDRPDRSADKIALAAFFDSWDAAFGDTPPNAAFTGVTAAGEEQESAFTLTDPVFDSGNSTVSFQAQLVPGAPELTENNYSDLHLFIDGIFSDILYPDNAKREGRLNELVADANTVFTDAHSLEFQITQQLQQLNEKAQSLYGRIHVPLPPIVNTEITPGYVVYAIESVATVVAFNAVKGGLEKLAVTFLKNEGRIGEAAFVRLVGLPRWMEVGKTGGAVLVAVGLDLAIDGVSGAVKRSNLRSGIHDLIATRLTLKRADLVNTSFLEALKVVNDSMEIMEELGYTKEQLDRLLGEKLEERVTNDIENKINEQYTLDYLRDFDTQRGSWTNEDH